jgi:hypothetical protein
MTDFDPVVDGGHSQIVSEESVSERQMGLLFGILFFGSSMTSVFARMI